MSKENPKLAQIIDRLVKLEQAVFGEKSSRVKLKKKSDFTGLKGGVNLLITQNYFNAKRTAPEVKKQLSDKNYHYSISAIQTTLNRLSARKGPLVGMKEGGKKYYVKRK